MTPQLLPHSDDLSTAEAEMSRQEAELDAELARVKALRREAQDHVQRARQQAEDPQLVAALGAVAVPTLTTRPQADESRMARLKALAVRKGCLETSKLLLKSHQGELDRVFDRVRAEEAGAKQRAVQKSAALEAEVRARAAVKAHEEEESLSATLIRAVESPPAPSLQQVAQRRATPRTALCAEISLGSDHNFFTGFTNDVSEGGVFVATVSLLPLGTQIDLAFSLPNGPRIEGKGEVRWVRELDERNLDAFPGMGIRFVDLPAASAAAIHAFTQQREPMFFPES